MRCISPILIRSSPGRSRHFVDDDGVDRFASNVAKAIGGSGMKRDYVPCGQCNFCLQTKRMDWSFRLSRELFKCQTAYFLTLTYDDKFLPVSEYHETPTLRKNDVQLFKKRLRQGNLKYSSAPLRYYSVGEYGTHTDRPHYHSIMFNLDCKVADRISDHWQLGNCFVGDVTPASINYVTKYVINRHRDNPAREPPFSLMSRRPGIGASYLDTHYNWHKSELRNYAQVNGVITRLPRYYKEKIFSPVERDALSKDAIISGDIGEIEERDRLSKYHDDPYYYREQLIAYKHESVTSKINVHNKF